MRPLILAAMLFSLPVAAKVHKVDIYDADTLSIKASGTMTGLRLRAQGFDAPEMNSSCAAERALARRAKDRLAALAAQGLRVSSELETDLYGRILATLRTPNGEDVATVLVREGLARSYDGKSARRPWCDASGKVVL